MFEKDVEDNAIARVENKILYYSDIEGIVPEKTAEEDSILIINNYIKNWIKDNLILTKAELNLKEGQKDIQKQLEDYRRSLLVYAYEKELINERLDTLVSNEEIKTYYESGQQHFDLRDDIVKVRYLKVNKKVPQVKKIRKIYDSNKEGDDEKLKELAHQFAETFHLNDNQWILFEELKKEVPITVAQSKGYLKNIKKIEVEDSLSYYFVYIKDYKLKNDVSPLSFEAHNIKNIIINKRKLSLINKIRGELYQDAIMRKDIEIYDTKNDTD
jgi:hypothetical protein